MVYQVGTSDPKRVFSPQFDERLEFFDKSILEIMNLEKEVRVVDNFFRTGKSTKASNTNNFNSSLTSDFDASLEGYPEQHSTVKVINILVLSIRN